MSLTHAKNQKYMASHVSQLPFPPFLALPCSPLPECFWLVPVLPRRTLGTFKGAHQQKFSGARSSQSLCICSSSQGPWSPECFFDDPTDVGNLISGSSALSKFTWTPGSSQFTYCWSVAWRILSITFLACNRSAIVWLFEHSSALPFFGIGLKTNLFQFCGNWWAF